MRRDKIIFGAALFATMIGVSPTAADAKPTLRARIHKLEKRQATLERTVSQLVAVVEAQQKELVKLRNADAAIKNTLMCLHAVPMPALTWGVGSNVFRLDTAIDTAKTWSVIADDYCLESQTLNAPHRLALPIYPPTFYTYEKVAP